MPRQIITLRALGLAVLLAACGGGATPSSTDDDVLSGISDADTPQELLSLLPTSLCDAQPSRWAFSGAGLTLIKARPQKSASHDHIPF